MGEIQNITLDILNIKRNQYIRAKQYEDGDEVIFRINDNGALVGLSDIVAEFSLRGWDGNVVIDSTTDDRLTIEGDTVHLIITADMIRWHGKLPYQLSLKTQSSQIISTVTGFVMSAKGIEPDPPTPPEPSGTVLVGSDFAIIIGSDGAMIGDNEDE